MNWSKQIAEAALAEAIKDCASACAEAGAQTVPRTPLPRMPQAWGAWAMRRVRGHGIYTPWHHAREGEQLEDPRLRAWTWTPAGDYSGDYADAWAAALAGSAGYQPARIARLIRQIERDTAWMRRCAEARRRMAAEIVRQQQGPMDAVTARVVGERL